ncbi:MAG: DUF1684 domain-containing protein [Bacteroidota bacterium]|nr:DUF1684 domain-containing protein [Bacteroidota bacterium]MEC8724426.1 DUF1684 domain-containing protein [Bacteroidota bacterium]
MSNCKQQKKLNLYDSEFQKKLNAFFKDVTTSPLKREALKSFESLPFFPIDSSFVTAAKLNRTPNSDFFEMPTSTTRLSKERVFGVLSFEFKSQIYKLNVYQSQISILEGDNTLLLPFLDDTNGLSSYGGGRYINIVIPESDSILLDFNMAYNPYCAYNERYSCPIVPKENYLPFRVEAGVMYNNEY